MCRMLAYIGGKEKLKKLAECLITSAKDDPITHDVHSDGWGIVAFQEDEIIYYRSVNPIFKEREKLINIIDSLKNAKVIIHARLATDKSLIASYLSHPYIESNEKGIFFIAHNGSVDKQSLGEALGINPKLMVDSELIGKYIQKKGIEGVKDLIKYTKSALNLLILYLDRESRKSHLYYFNYYNKDYIRSKRIPEEYYKMYIGENYIFSSSLAYTGCDKMREAEFGELKEL
ncbi:class II glutamine amidotransferase [Sulfurisphaera ohwakuensis]|uniref:Glutamine amidotransferase n=1 Tax=Sulfurisphaera ohwakuensis TaxID=69656 RepID=A0A650CIQ9_SULOH|nr:class II glutamine amidotransferase [Sulfurisphaera ohwakuensis]MBB5253766.1 glutamine amidotransferase [Sulfurisphaera ohwakuensis]QGR17555.1 class II glutamine amidotransferase [Sulfurisphaera ohwakuensis]